MEVTTSYDRTPNLENPLGIRSSLENGTQSLFSLQATH